MRQEIWLTTVRLFFRFLQLTTLWFFSFVTRQLASIERASEILSKYLWDENKSSSWKLNWGIQRGRPCHPFGSGPPGHPLVFLHLCALCVWAAPARGGVSLTCFMVFACLPHWTVSSLRLRIVSILPNSDSLSSTGIQLILVKLVNGHCMMILTPSPISKSRPEGHQSSVALIFSPVLAQGALNTQ